MYKEKPPIGDTTGGRNVEGKEIDN